MRISTFPLGPLETNCYLIDNEEEAVVIDPGGDPQAILDFLAEQNLGLTHVLCTHLHFDHTYGIAKLQSKADVLVYASLHDAYMLESELGRGGLWGMPTVPPYTFTNVLPGPLTLLGVPCQVLSTPGHTPGGLSFYFPKQHAVFVGDTLFFHSIGRTDFPGGDAPTLQQSIRTQLYTLPKTVTVYAGHGPETSIDNEMKNNPFVGGEME